MLSVPRYYRYHFLVFSIGHAPEIFTGHQSVEGAFSKSSAKQFIADTILNGPGASTYVAHDEIDQDAYEVETSQPS